MSIVDRAALRELLKDERRRFEQRTEASRTLFEEAKRSLLGGVPMHWMTEWASPYPLFLASAGGAAVTDADGNR